MNLKKPLPLNDHRATASLSPISRIPGFYLLSVEQRLTLLKQDYSLTDEELAFFRHGSAIKAESAVNMIENAIGSIGVPLGLAPNFLINGRDYLIPMATEEPSVVAAASRAARLIRAGGGFIARSDQSVMIGQIQLVDLPDVEKAVHSLHRRKGEILKAVDDLLPRMKERGGGAVDIETRIIGDNYSGTMLIVHILIDVCDAMGANVINGVCERVGPHIEKITGARANMKILSNLADRRLARAEFAIPVSILEQDDLSGAEVAARLVQASRWARLDPYRAATHNKGIFNGIAAVALAFGLDWRAIEAGGHAYAARDGVYRGLTEYRIEQNVFYGTIELPLQVAWTGETSCHRPDIRALKKIIGVASARELAGVLAAVGLAQNLAACLALCTEGIQRGHMALHARYVAAGAGIPGSDIEQVASEMIRSRRVHIDAAADIYDRLQNHQKQMVHKNEILARTFAPGKVILFGEHAVVYGYPSIVTALEQGTRLEIRRDKNGPRLLHPSLKASSMPFCDDNDYRYFSQAAHLALTGYNLVKEPMEIWVESDLVPGVGLGSSAAFSVALCRAFAEISEIGQSTGGPDLREMVHLLETVFHRNPSGADAAAILEQNAVWFQKGQPNTIAPVQSQKECLGMVCVVDEPRRTAEMVATIEQARKRNKVFVDGIFDDIGDVTVDAALALRDGQIEKLGRLMVRNHELLARLDLSTPRLDRAVANLLDMGLPGAKLTGAGGGGAVVMILPDNAERENIIAQIQERFHRYYHFTIQPR